MAKDYYTILGVSRGASDEEIKRAYRKLAQEHHPDKGGEEKRFKEVSEAYSILGSKEKRAQYDRFGTASPNGDGFNGFGGFSGAGGESPFGDIGDIFESFFGQAFSQVQAQLSISLTQAVLGDTLELEVGGERVRLTVPPGTQDQTSFRLPGKGRAHRNGRGDLILTVKIMLPRRLSRDQRRLFEELKKTGL